MKIFFLLTLLVFSSFALAYAEENQITHPYTLQEFVSVNALHSDSAPLMHLDLTINESSN